MGPLDSGTQDEAGSELVLGTNTGRTLCTFTAARTYRLIKQRMKTVSRTLLLNDWSSRIHLTVFCAISCVMFVAFILSTIKTMNTGVIVQNKAHILFSKCKYTYLDYILLHSVNFHTLFSEIFLIKMKHLCSMDETKTNKQKKSCHISAHFYRTQSKLQVSVCAHLLCSSQRITLQHEGHAGPPTERLQLTCIAQEDSFMCYLYNTPW